MKKAYKEAYKEAYIESLSHDARGVSHIDGKATFIENALPDEQVSFIYTKKRSNFDEGKAEEVLKSSPHRTSPKCEHFGICGGCSLQHLIHDKQLEFKTKNLLEQIKHFGGIENTENIDIQQPIIGPIWNYRSRARLSVKYVEKKQKVLVGFHEKSGRYVADINKCSILHATVSDKLVDLSNLIRQLSIYNQVPQIEVACGDNTTALLFRHLDKFTDSDIILLRKFEQDHNIKLYLQPGNAQTIHPLTRNTENTENTALSYKLPEYNIEMLFDFTDFTQINQDINQQMISIVTKLLDIQPTDKILDLFCGIGNFTLPIATKCAKAIGVEGNNSAILHAIKNAQHNSINNTEFYCADLTKDFINLPWALQHYDKILLDPPRTGAYEICQQIKKFEAKTIVYVSCNPATLARDIKELIGNGYKLKNIRIMDMFPHTSHVETIALLQYE